MMVRTKTRMRVCTSLLCLILAFIWGNSLLPGSVSAAISQWVKDLIASLFPFGGGDPQTGHGLLRKLAHFTEFAGLGMCLLWLCSMLGKKTWLPLTAGFLAACVDETIQLFVPGRGPAVLDVLIDTCGVAVGMGLLLVVYNICKKKLRSKTGGNEL